DRLLAIGQLHPAQILLPTSDETAWQYTVNATLLEQHFCIYQPPVETMRRILDKQLLADSAIQAGLAVLPSWFPQSVDDVAALAPTLTYPVLIKPRTHRHRIRNDKGVVAHSAGELIDQYRQIVHREEACSPARSPKTNPPVLQQFVHVGSEGVQSITGFLDRTGELFVTRRSTKVLLRSEPVGVGVCFKSMPPCVSMSATVRRLCRELGYFGIFEVEFLRFNGEWAIIDFNPRLFNQMAMDIHRGMPLPLLACLDALGEEAALHQAISKARAKEE